MAKGEYGHEDLRLQFETLVQSVSKGLLQLMDKGSYQTLPVNNPPTWWVHLVLIYYKRHFCNKKKGMLCPLVLNGLISQPNCCSI